MNLLRALRTGPRSQMAFTGAGGKTTAVFSLARELVGEAGTVLVTTTTHFGVDQVRLGDMHIAASGPEEVAAALEGVEGVVVVTSGREDEGRTTGIDLRIAEELAEFAQRRGLPLLVEADGSRMRPLKAPAAHEPVVPDFVEAVVVCAGLSGLGKPVGAEWVHRPERFGELAGLAHGAPVTAAALAAVLRSADGGLKGAPAGARAIALLNQADTAGLQAQGRRIAGEILGDFDAVLVAALAEGEVYAVHEPAAGIVLAAGGSTRMGRPKPLLDWGGGPLVAHVAGLALAAGCDPVFVVTGAEGEAVKAAVADLPVRVVHNPDWREGQSSSVRAGLREASRAGGASSARGTAGSGKVGSCGSAMFLLVDQPFVEATMIRKLIETHAASLAPIVAPLIRGQRGNPVLFDRATFPEFEGLTGDSGGRALFARHRVEWVEWHDERALQDLDTEADYTDLGGL